MRTQQLFLLTILGKKKRKEATLEKLQELGLLHIRKATTSIKHLQEAHVLEGVDEISKLLLQLHYLAEHTGIQGEYQLKELPKKHTAIKQAQALTKKYLEKAQELVEAQKHATAQINQLNTQLALLKKLPTNINLDPSTNTKTVIVSSSKPLEPKSIKHTHIIKAGKDKKDFLYALTYLKNNEQAVRKALLPLLLRELDYSFVTSSTKKYQQEAQEQLTQEVKRKQEADHALSALLQGQESKIQELVLTLENYYELHQMGSKCQVSNELFLLQGYAVAQDVKKIKRELKDVNIMVHPAKKNVPTKMKTSVFRKGFEQITTLFGVPTYGLVDPTPLVIFFYPLFFGFMLSDVGYGLLLLLTVGLLWYKFGKKFTPAVHVFGASGISSVIFGLIFGSFFGNLIPITPLYADSFSASFTILQISLAIGLIHLNLGVIMKVYQMILKKEKAFTIIAQSAPFPLLQLMGLLFALGQPIIATVCALVAVSLLLKEQGLFGLMDITGYFGTWFSYARLLALSLATSGVALAINIIAQKTLALGKIGLIPWLLILIIGHTINFGLNILGCTIHSARLHYVEFFSFFFEGEGYLFKPFNVKKHGGIKNG